jgi:hypothetical protein
MTPQPKKVPVGYSAPHQAVGGWRNKNVFRSDVETCHTELDDGEVPKKKLVCGKESRHKEI